MKEDSGAAIKLNPIKNGTVLDHLPAKSALKIVRVLGLSFDAPVMIAIGIESKSMGKKDLIFIEGKELSKKEVQTIGLIAEGSTWNIIKDQKVISKKKIELPTELIGIITCNNPKCITTVEDIDTKFVMHGKKALCEYCEREMNMKEVIKLLK